MSLVRDELFVVSYPSVVVVLDHPVTFECQCWTIFKASVSAVLHLWFFVSLCIGLLAVCVPPYAIFAETDEQCDFSNQSKDHPNLI
jgi:hypothetical protein